MNVLAETSTRPANKTEVMPRLAMALAMDRNQLIGKDNAMPWHVPGEQAHFKMLTMGKPIIMGRSTFDSIGRPLPGRANIVVTRNRQWQADGVHVAHSLDDAVAIAQDLPTDLDDPEVVVIGGAALCNSAMPATSRLYLTVIDHAFEGDTYFDSFHWQDWQEIAREEPDAASTGGYSIAYLVLERKQAKLSTTG